MQSLRRALTLRLPKHDIFSSSLRQQTASMANEAHEGSGDSRLQLMLKALEPQEIEDIEMTPDELAEAEKRFVNYFLL